MIQTLALRRKAFVGQWVVESTDISGYSADVRPIPIDAATIANPTSPSNRQFVGDVRVRTSLGVAKDGFIVVYHPTGAYAGYLTVQEGTSTFSTSDVITVWGALTSLGSVHES